MKERMRFVREHERGAESVASLCRRFGISRKTGYKWLRRYYVDGGCVDRMADRSRRPHRHPTRTAEALEAAIVEARKARPRWGPKKLRAWFGRQRPDLALPAVSTFAKILRRHGLVAPRRRRLRTPPVQGPFGSIGGPNALWCVDFKGHFAVGATRCHPLTVMDAHSRYLVACVGLRRPDATQVRRAFERIFEEFGLPDAIRTDNGPPFATPSTGGLSRLSAWWMKLGIRHERIAPGRPDQNGRLERMHRTLKQETAAPPCSGLAAQQRAFDRFRHEYNDLRPHEALGQEIPAAFYQRSRRPLPIPSWGRDFGYPAELETARSDKHGVLRWRNQPLPVSAALRHELLGLKPTGPDRWAVHFGSLRIGRIDRKPRSRFRLRFVRDEKVSPMSVE